MQASLHSWCGCIAPVASKLAYLQLRLLTKALLHFVAMLLNICHLLLSARRNASSVKGAPYWRNTDVLWKHEFKSPTRQQEFKSPTLESCGNKSSRVLLDGFPQYQWRRSGCMPVMQMPILSPQRHGCPLNGYSQHKQLLQSVRTLVYRGLMWGVGKERCEVVVGGTCVACR